MRTYSHGQKEKSNSKVVTSLLQEFLGNSEEREKTSDKSESTSSPRSPHKKFIAVSLNDKRRSIGFSGRVPSGSYSESDLCAAEEGTENPATPTALPTELSSSSASTISQSREQSLQFQNLGIQESRKIEYLVPDSEKSGQTGNSTIAVEIDGKSGNSTGSEEGAAKQAELEKKLKIAMKRIKKLEKKSKNSKNSKNLTSIPGTLNYSYS